MTNIDLITLFAKTEERYLKCWEILKSMKEFKLNIDEFPLFQPLLCDTILELSNAYKQIHQLRQKLIDRKGKYLPSWFASRQKMLSGRQKAISETISIGRVIGDAFAWFFYQNDGEYLREHAKHEFSPHMPPGFGGIGEREFLKNVKAVNGLMVLYHGTTNILRIGDISLIDLKKFKVEAIGELKTTTVEPGKLNISLHLIGSSKIKNIFSEITVLDDSEIKSSDNLPQSMKARLARQMKRMSNMLAPNNQNSNLGKVDKEERRHIRDFESAFSKAKVGEFSYQQLGAGLLCAIYREKERNLYSKQLSKNKTDFGSKMEEMTKYAQNLILENSCHNKIIFSTLLYSSEGKSNPLTGTLPLFWWPLNIEFIKEIIFQDAIAINIYNPAHLIALFETKGFSVLPDKDNRSFRLKFPIGTGEIEVVGMWYFMYLIYHDMFDEKQIVDLIDEIIDNIRNRNPSNSEHIDIQFNHRLRF